SLPLSRRVSLWFLHSRLPDIYPTIYTHQATIEREETTVGPSLPIAITFIHPRCLASSSWINRMGRPSSGGVGQPKLRKGLWSPEEDAKLYSHIIRHGVGCWSSVPRLAGLNRCGKSCRLRWINYLRPDLKRGCFSQQEEDHIVALHHILGNRSVQLRIRSAMQFFSTILQCAE
uniref:Uncharacterized protein n=1 Tax=Aegilops tauschii subsp. strangulata TaxID=200361 RepID=A0A452ZQS1_AEGTS